LNPWEPASLIFAAALTADAQPLPVTLSAREYDHAAYHERLRTRTGHCDMRADVPLNRLRNSRLAPFFEEMRAAKTTLIMMDWIEQADMRTLEDEYQTTAGQILAAAGQIAWIMDAAAEITGAIGAPQHFKESVLDVAQRMRHGLSAEALPLAPACAANLLQREQAIALVASGLTDPQSLRIASPALLEKILGETAAARLKAWVQAQPIASAPPAPAAPARSDKTFPVLKIDLRQPGLVFVDGEAVRIQDKQYQLIRILAQHPGECVSYDEIYGNLWKDVFVEPAQMYAQKRRLLEAIALRAPNRGEMIVTVPKHGYRLDLSPSEVELHETECAAGI
jgi:helicase